MKKNTILFLLLFSSTFFYGQYGKNCEITQLKINVFNPSIEYEKGLGVNTTLDIKLGMQLAINPALLEPLEDFEFLPAINVQYRYYYNFNSRDSRGRQIYGNSANYIAPTTAAFVATSSINNTVTNDIVSYAGLVTGIQRSFNSGFNFSIDAGAAYYMGYFKGGIYPVVNLSIGWIVNQQRWCKGR